ncbi:MAG: DUF2344 domain-containing protein, partial [Candidatus Adiutrix sp.]
LPLGTPSFDEYLRIVTCDIIEPENLVARLSNSLPPDITLKGAKMLPLQSPKPKPVAATWQLVASKPLFAELAPPHPEAVVLYQDKKGRQGTHHLSEFVSNATATDNTVTLTIALGTNGTPKPIAAVQAMWGLSSDDLADIRLFKLETHL